jgi:hypothetical protein
MIRLVAAFANGITKDRAAVSAAELSLNLGDEWDQAAAA